MDNTKINELIPRDNLERFNELIAAAQNEILEIVKHLNTEWGVESELLNK